MPATLLHSFRRFETVFGSQKGFEIWKILQKPRQKHNIFANLQEMFVVSLSSFVIQQQILNLTNQCSLFMTVHHIFWDQWGWPSTQHRWSRPRSLDRFRKDDATTTRPQSIEIIDIECVLDHESCLHFFSCVPL
jgi:hypothetical protein